MNERHSIATRLDPSWRDHVLAAETGSPAEDAMARTLLRDAAFLLPDYPHLVGVEWLVRRCDAPHERTPTGRYLPHSNLPHDAEVGRGDLLFRGPAGLAVVEVKATRTAGGPTTLGARKRRQKVVEQVVYYAEAAREMWRLPVAGYAYTDECGLIQLYPPSGGNPFRALRLCFHADATAVYHAGNSHALRVDRGASALWCRMELRGGAWRVMDLWDEGPEGPAMLAVAQHVLAFVGTTRYGS